MDVRASSRTAPGTLIDDQLVADQRQAHELCLRYDRATARARATRDSHYDETSESHEIARWRSRARSPMSMPVAVAT